MNVPPVWQAYCKLRPSLAHEIPLKTRVLYRSLLRESMRFTKPEMCTFLRLTIKERFRFHEHETSAKRALNTIQEGQRVCALDIIRMALEGNAQYYSRIESMTDAEIGPLAFVKEKTRKIADPMKRYQATLDMRPQKAKSQRPEPGFAIPMPAYILQVDKPLPKKPKTAKLSKRKPYMKAIKVQCASGRNFIRVRGWVQPKRTSMMIKATMMTNQKRVNRIKLYEEYIRLLSGEADFLKDLGVDNRDILGAGQTIRAVLADAYKQFNKPQNGTSSIMKESNSKHTDE